jgi:hypothetical protein
MPFSEEFKNFFNGLNEIAHESSVVRVLKLTGNEYIWTYNYFKKTIDVQLPCETDVLDVIEGLGRSFNCSIVLDDIEIYGDIVCKDKLTHTRVSVRTLNILSKEKDCCGMFYGTHFDEYEKITINANDLIIDSMFANTNLKEVEFKSCRLMSVDKPFEGSSINHLILNNCTIELYKYLDYNYGEFACSELLPTLIGNSDIEKITLVNCDDSFIEEFMEHVRLVEDLDDFNDLEIVIN